MSGQPTSNQSATILVPISPGELIDKITILQIKQAEIDEPERLANVEHELTLLAGVQSQSVPESPELGDLTAQLKSINEELWQIEDDIRECERSGDFGSRFVELARSVYRTNDRRSQVKRLINELLGSSLIEEKSYAEYE